MADDFELIDAAYAMLWRPGDTITASALFAQQMIAMAKSQHARITELERDVEVLMSERTYQHGTKRSSER